MTATALGLVNTLRAKTRTVDPAAIKDDDYGWGTYQELRGIDTKSLTRQELRNHLEARDLPTTGNKGQLALRLEASVLDEQSKAYADAEDAEFQLGADLEERGAVYVVGANSSGQLGLGDLAPRDRFEVVPETRGAGVSFVAAGYDISFAVTEDHDVLSWGAKGTGATGHRLGTGAFDDDDEDLYKEPRPIRDLVGEEVCQVQAGSSHCLAASKGGDLYVSCGPSFCLAVTPGNVWSWGTGEGFVLGHGDTIKRDTPVPIEAFKGSAVLQAECGTWHCAALILVPPCKDGGYLYTWGSGYHGQLALGTRQVQATPSIVTKLLTTQQLLTKVWCGSHHCAAVTTDGELYTWGSNRSGCLGRTLPDDQQYTADPGHVGGFGVLVDGVGRGLPRAVACGKEFTLVATYPYEGPVMDVAMQVMQASAIEEEEIRLLEEEQLRQQKKAGKDRKRELEKAAQVSRALAGKVPTKLCSICDECPGFRPTPVRETICIGCHHSVSFHTRLNKGESTASYSAADSLSKY
eukprot:g8159.t1